jgi:pyruvate,water dikinase
MEKLIKPFSEINVGDVAETGGKNSSLGEMFTQLSSKGIKIPDGFATTAFAFKGFLAYNQIGEVLQEYLKQLDTKQFTNLRETGAKARETIMAARLQPDFERAIIEAYGNLCGRRTIEVAVRSSATAEDLPEASFAGQHDTYLNIKGKEALVQAVQKCFASLYTDRAIKYREDHGFDHAKVALSVGVQKMVRSDKACAGVGFTLDPESGFRNVVLLSGVWGLGENIVQGAVIPDEFYIFKPALLQHKKAIIQKRMGDKARTMVYARKNNSASPTINKATPSVKRKQYVLTDEEIITLAGWACLIEEHYEKPMDIEWAKDGITNELFIVQARPETVHSQQDPYKITEYRLSGKGESLVTGEAIGSKLAIGNARLLDTPKESDKLQDGEIVVTDITSPDWDPVLKRSGGIITNKGGRTSHAAIVARELGVPAIVGCGDATEKIKDGQQITMSCTEGKTGTVYNGKLPFEKIEHDFRNIKMPGTVAVMMILGEPDAAFKLSFYPSNGVGLMRMEFIITHFIKIHPMALVKFKSLKDSSVKQQIEKLTYSYADKERYFVDRLAEGIATIAAAFYPKEVLVRMSDFKTNEYANLLGGKDFEPKEENPMLGLRGASRYYNELYKDGFRLECEAIKTVRDQMGFDNVKVMIPFCRTVEEGKKVVGLMEKYGLSRGGNNTLEIYMMAELPVNVLLAEEFAEVFDGFSIGSNDLTQLILGIDRDSAEVSDLFDEQHKAVKTMIADVIKKATAHGAKIGLCGQAPSDFPDFAAFLVEQGINSISFSPDALLKGIEHINRAKLK